MRIDTRSKPLFSAAGTPALRRLSPGLLGAVMLSAALCVSPVHAAKKVQAPTSVQEDSYALVQLNGEPLATYERTKPPKGKKIDFASNTARSYRAQLAKLRNDYKAWLRRNVPGAKVTGEFDIALNAVAVKLNGATLGQVAAAPMVRFAQLQGLYSPNDAGTDPDLALIFAEQAWEQGGGAGDAGAGVKVAIVDSGIDITHPCFDDAGYPSVGQVGDPKYTNNKVIAARVFNNQLNRNGFDAEAVDSHGTHVAGTAACNHLTPAAVNGVTIPYDISGVAPRALLGNYNVFPGDVEDARSEDILNALEAAYEDGFDIANMSLGGASSGVQDLLTMAVDNLDRANMVVTIANGNEGPGYFTVGSPGMAERGLTAGASSVPHYVGTFVVTGGGDKFGAASGEFETVDADFPGELSVVFSTEEDAPNGLDTACDPLVADSLKDKIAVISRGGCTFTTKIFNAEDAGAVAVLVVNNVAGDPTAMAQDGSEDQPSIPAYMVGQDDADGLKSADSMQATIEVALSYVESANQNIMAGFSSQGPTDVRFRVKPDLVAPGVNVLSSVPETACEESESPPCFAFFSGTSMAAPHLAGAAAVIRQQHPDWTAAEVRSAVVNTAQGGVLYGYEDGASGDPEEDVNIVGSGLLNLEAAVNAVVALDPVSLSFGGIPSGSGQTRTLQLTLTNISGSSASFVLQVSSESGASVEYSVSQDIVSLGEGESAVVEVTVAAPKGASSSMEQAMLEISAGGAQVAHAALFTLLK